MFVLVQNHYPKVYKDHENLVDPNIIGSNINTLWQYPLFTKLYLQSTTGKKYDAFGCNLMTGT